MAGLNDACICDNKNGVVAYSSPLKNLLGDKNGLYSVHVKLNLMRR